jgi:AcrR family transcriptional regulator
MDRVGRAIEYAKGTVYRHFANKEDIVVAIGVEIFTHEVNLFERAAALEAITRERFMACGVALELHHRLYPAHLQVSQICGTPDLFEKASPERRRRLRELEDKCMGTIANICREATEVGDLRLEPGVTPEMVVFGPWATFTGAQVLMDANIPIVEKRIADVQAALWLNVQKMVDGFGWQPLSSEHDYQAVRERLLAGLFAQEVEALAARSPA